MDCPLWPPGWWAARCGPSRLKERSLWTFS
ncbi:hypothetical protein GWI33_006367, partial [Rhynchophorus ferrugineus]